MNGEGIRPVTTITKADRSRRCTVPSCGRHHYAKGHCQAHYRRVWRHGGAFEAIGVHEMTDKQREIRCKRGCKRPHLARGLCQTHYRRELGRHQVS